VTKRGPGGPRIRPVEEEGIDYAPEVDPYEDMDVEGLLNLEDYVPPQGEKQIAPKPPKYQKYQIDPSYWQLDPTDPPPDYEPPDEETPAIAAPPDDDNVYCCLLLFIRKVNKIHNMMYHCSQSAKAIRGQQWLDALN